MIRIDQIFHDLRQANKRALMPFLTAGYPTLDATEAILPAIADAGASICEIGFPFSDPIADGPIIQESMTAALKHKITLEQIFGMVKKVRQKTELGLVAMVSYSIVYRMGVETFISKSKESGFDGFIIPDLPLEEAERVVNPIREAELSCSLLIAPTTPIERAKQIISYCSGFVYILARTGITGERADLPEDLLTRLAEIKKLTDLPLAVGFGISQPEHVKAVTQVADAAIVGSAVVRMLKEYADQPTNKQAQGAAEFIAHLASGLN